MWISETAKYRPLQGSRNSHPLKKKKSLQKQADLQWSGVKLGGQPHPFSSHQGCSRFCLHNTSFKPLVCFEIQISGSSEGNPFLGTASTLSLNSLTEPSACLGGPSFFGLRLCWHKATEFLLVELSKPFKHCCTSETEVICVSDTKVRHTKSMRDWQPILHEVRILVLESVPQGPQPHRKHPLGTPALVASLPARAEQNQWYHKMGNSKNLQFGQKNGP